LGNKLAGAAAGGKRQWQCLCSASVKDLRAVCCSAALFPFRNREWLGNYAGDCLLWENKNVAGFQDADDLKAHIGKNP
jgi:hypothetical protein